MKTPSWLLLVFLYAAGCSSDAPPRSPAATWTPEPVNSDHLPNAYRLHDKVISGGQPEGEAAFRELRTLGVRTIISVDGAPPLIDLARKHGLRYVHLPHGYDGVPVDRALALAKAVRDLPGPIYIHCHHGKHRSPTAAVVACVGAGLLTPRQALSVLQTAGTNPDYRGLYHSAEQAQRWDDALLDRLEIDFPETAETTPLAEAMVAIDHIHERLKRIQQSGWTSSKEFDAVHEALLLREQFTELLRSDAVSQQSEPFLELLRRSEAAAADLQAELERWFHTGPPIPSEASAAFQRITDACQSCHRQFRDVPQSERHSDPP